MKISRMAGVGLVGFCAMAMVISLGGCTAPPVSRMFSNEKFVPTPVPSDFALAVEENEDNYFARRHVRQIITASDMMSRTTYTTLRDYNNEVAEEFTTETPLNQAQVQAMWDEVQRQHLLEGAFTWYFWKSSSDQYKTDVRTMQIRANGKTKSYHELNHWDGALRDLALLADSVRLPSGQDVSAGSPASRPSTETNPATSPPQISPEDAVTPATGR